MEQILVPIFPPIPIPGVTKVPCQGTEQIKANKKHMFYDYMKVLKTSRIYLALFKTGLNSPFPQPKELYKFRAGQVPPYT